MPEPRRPRRGPQRPRGTRSERDERRPNWEPRDKRSSWRHSDDPSSSKKRRDERNPKRESRPPRAQDKARSANDRARDLGRDSHREYEERRDSVYYPSRHAAPFVENDDTKLERLRATTVHADDVADATFAGLGLGPGIAGALKSMGAEHPFPIQAAAIPPALEGRDVLGRGRTGSGKTIAFAGPIVEQLLRNRPERRAVGRPPRALVVAPTRELALQIDRTMQSVGKAVGIFTTTVVGGVRQGPQVRALERGVDILIGTPGRIEDLVEQRYLDLGRVEIAVIDEADHMCELGFLEPVQRLLRRTRPDSQKLLFSATLDTEVDALVAEFLREPAVVEVADADDIAPIDHRVLVVERGAKDAVLDQIVAGPGPILVFAATRVYAQRLATRFEEQGRRVASLHGDLNQHRRTRSLELLRRGKIDVLVATDVAARGIHVDDVALVVQADPPDEYKTYLHRSGRTGRAGNSGAVVTLIAPSRIEKMQALLERAEIRAPMIPVTPGDDILDSLGAH